MAWIWPDQPRHTQAQTINLFSNSVFKYSINTNISSDLRMVSRWIRYHISYEVVRGPYFYILGRIPEWSPVFVLPARKRTLAPLYPPFVESAAGSLDEACPCIAPGHHVRRMVLNKRMDPVFPENLKSITPYLKGSNTIQVGNTSW